MHSEGEITRSACALEVTSSPITTVGAVKNELEQAIGRDAGKFCRHLSRVQSTPTATTVATDSESDQGDFGQVGCGLCTKRRS